jgi:hypothetical protein
VRRKRVAKPRRRDGQIATASYLHVVASNAIIDHKYAATMSSGRAGETAHIPTPPKYKSKKRGR